MTLLSSTPEYVLPFAGPGTVLIFSIVLVPVYMMLAGWWAGEPTDRKTIALGLTYLVGLTTTLWGGLFVATMVIDFLFF